ncbi:unnamed protein product [Mytilus coruscus]|uniref:Ig-like domain-containing protein n=1 Tax=Mytilus coruscus TaxID=42192 RepID=A0A6J8CTC4_MYTCO|nr:unnamed protein product [Mytilus coruscus]
MAKNNNGITIRYIILLQRIPTGESKYRFEIKNTDLLWFKNQTDINTIVGQEGTDMEIKCSSHKPRYVYFWVALIITSNGSFKAIGYNQSVSYSFIPNRTDHLTTYKCEPTALLSISAEVKLIIKLNLSDKTFNITTEPFLYQKNGKYMCVVSNGVPDANGKILQSWSTNVVHEGPPVFAPENRNLIHGRIGKSIKLSFYIYSNPDVEEIIIENIGPKPTKREQIKHYNILNSTLIYSEYNKLVGIEGYEILIESKVLDMNDFHLYRNTAKNRLGVSNYHFAIIKNDVLDDYLPQREVSEVEVQRQFMSTTSDNTNRSNTDSSQISSSVISRMENIANCNQTDENTNTETSSDQMNQTSNDSDSDTLNNVMIDNVGEYENNYQCKKVTCTLRSLKTDKIASRLLTKIRTNNNDL